MENTRDLLSFDNGKGEQEPLVKYPDIEVTLSGEDGNAFAVMGAVTKAMRRHVGVGEVFETREEMQAAQDEFRKEAMSGDYDHLLQTAMKTVSVS